MAAGKWNMQKASGGVASITIADGVSNTEVIVPESGILATKQYVDDADYLQPSLTADATLTGIDNKIVMNGIVTSLGLEIGDVIQFTSVANANNQKMRTVESIINDNEIIVNYEHCGSRKNGALKLTDETLTNATIKRIAKWYNTPIGLGQDVIQTGNLAGVTYSTPPNRSMCVYFDTTIAASTIVLIGGVRLVAADAGWAYGASIIVPANSNYNIVGGTVKIQELR